MTLLNSFRWRLALLATTVCAVILLGFSWILWSHLMAAETDRVDREIEHLAHFHVGISPAEAAHHHEHQQQHRHQQHQPRRQQHQHQEHQHQEHQHQEHEHPHTAVGQHPIAALFLGEELRDLVVWMRRADGTTLFKSHNWPGELSLPDWVDPAGGSSDVRLTSPAGDTGTWRMAQIDSRDRSVAVAVSMAHFEARMHDMGMHWVLTLMAALVCACAGAFWLASRALRPVQALTASLEQITAERLHRRVPDSPGHSEFQRLVRVCNEMLGRLERSFDQAVRFSADASHEMKTPLTIMQGQVEAAMQAMPEGSDGQQALATQLEEIGRLKNLVQKLLLLSQADAGALPLQKRRLDLGQAVAAVAEDTRVLAPELEVETDLGDSSVFVDADDGLLQQLLQNLAANAIKYNRDGGKVRFALRHDGGHARLWVDNTGTEVPEADRERIFERFYRRDQARSRAVEGLGLGLSLAREIARAHGGELSCRGASAGVNRFELRLPSSLAS